MPNFKYNGCIKYTHVNSKFFLVQMPQTLCVMSVFHFVSML